MPCCVSVAARVLAENHGKRRENGVERTSAIASAPASCSNAIKRSAAIFEWPMLNRSKDDIVRSLAEKAPAVSWLPAHARRLTLAVAPAFLQGPAALQCYRTVDEECAG